MMLLHAPGCHRWLFGLTGLRLRTGNPSIPLSLQGRTVVHTIAAILVLALVSPVWDAYRLSTEAQPQIASAATNVQVRYV